MFRAAKIAGYIKVTQRMGISVNQLLEGTRIDPDRVTNPNYLISLDQYYAVVANMMRLTNNPGIAFSLGELGNVKDMGIVGYAMMSARTLREASMVWMEYSNSLIGASTNIQYIREVSPGYEMTFSSGSRFNALHRFETEEILVQGITLLSDLIGTKPVIGEISLAYPVPRHRKLYEDFFNCPLKFDAPTTSLRIFKPVLDTTFRTSDEELFQLCTHHCQQVMKSIPGDSLLRSRLRSIFLTTPGALPDLSQASTTLGISVTTLRRQLDADGLSYQAIKDEFRYDLAREYLRSGRMSSKKVSYLLGFAAPNAFSRAFKSWSGQTVGEFLKSESGA